MTSNTGRVVVWKQASGRSYMIDWQRMGVGRIARSSGTAVSKIHGAVIRMLDTLYDAGEINVLKAIKAGELHPLAIYDQWRRTRTMPNVESLKPLRQLVDAWLDGSVGRKRNNYRTGLNRFLRHGDAKVTLAMLPALARADKKASAHEAPSFNRAKASWQTFARETLGRQHPAYQALRDITVLPEHRAERPRLTVLDALTIRQRLSKAHGALWWHLCITGMILSEYAGAWRVLRDGVEIAGTKAAGRKRVVPFVERMARVAVDRREFSEALTRLGVESYDARRAYAHWLEEAKIPRARRKLYMGHGSADVTDLYEMGELSAYRAQDGKALARYIKREANQSGRKRAVSRQRKTARGATSVASTATRAVV